MEGDNIDATDDFDHAKVRQLRHDLLEELNGDFTDDIKTRFNDKKDEFDQIVKDTKDSSPLSPIRTLESDDDPDEFMFGPKMPTLIIKHMVVHNMHVHITR